MKTQTILLLFAVLFASILFISCSDDENPGDIPLDTCDVLSASIVDSTSYNNDDFVTADVINAVINEDCLEIRIQDCNSAEFFGLVALEEWDQNQPPRRMLKYRRECSSISSEQVTWSINVSPLRVDTSSSVLLIIENWSDPVVYEY